MNAGEMHKLARLLREVAIAATSEPGEQRLSLGVLAIVEDVSANPGSTIGEVARRTGLAQSLVSSTVATLRERGVVDVAVDPQDRRRTVVQVNRRAKRSTIDPRGERPVTDALRQALEHRSPAQVRKAERLLDQLAEAILR